MDEGFPSEHVDETALKGCFRSYILATENVISDMRKNEIALRIAKAYFNEGYSKRVIDLAEKMYFMSTSPSESDSKPATIKTDEVKTKPTVNKNPFSRYKI